MSPTDRVENCGGCNGLNYSFAAPKARHSTAMFQSADPLQSGAKKSRNPVIVGIAVIMCP